MNIFWSKKQWWNQLIDDSAFKMIIENGKYDDYNGNDSGNGLDKNDE